MKFRINQGIVLRICASLVLAGVVVLLFVMNSTSTSIRRSGLTKDDWRVSLVEIDRQVDTVLTHHGVDVTLFKKKLIAVPGANFTRIERKIDIAPDVLPILMNAELNEMAHEYGGRAIASENIKENLTTIHIALGGFVVQTIIVKPMTEPRMNKRKMGARKS